MKKLLMMKIFIAIFILAFAGIASATTFTFTQAELLGMVESWDNPTGIGDLDTKTAQAGGVLFVGDIEDGLPQWRSIGIGYPWGSVPVSAQNLSGYTDYALTFINQNNQNWYVNLFMNTGWTDAPWSELDSYNQNGWVQLAPTTSTTIVLDFSNAERFGGYTGWGPVQNLQHVTNIGFQLAFNDPTITGGKYQGDKYHMQVNPIPEPSTIILLGLGFLGLGAYGLHRKKKSEAS